MENEQEEYNQQETVKRKNGLILPLILVGILLAGSIGYNLYQGNKLTESEKNDSLNSQIIKNETDQKELIRKQYDSILNDYTQYKARIEDRNNLLQGNENTIQLKNQDIQGVLNKDNPSVEELNHAKKLISDLKSSISSYKTQVAKLEKENAILVRSVQDLNNRNENLTNDNNNLREANKNLSNDYEIVKNDNEANKSKINDLSSTLSISNHKIQGIRVRKSGKEVEKTNARRVNKIHVSFDVDRNSRAESGTKKLYIAIYNPNGTLGKYENSNGGQIELRSGEKVNYSDAITFNYINGQSKNLTFDWANQEFEKGEYVVNIYENGFKISQAKIKLD